ncbi:hypothetical protein G6F19_012039 [Rhizopus arrhizus]|nr:hypothetical protein G6F19_012039 [Rhizopus arrhizus]
MSREAFQSALVQQTSTMNAIRNASSSRNSFRRKPWIPPQSSQAASTANNLQFFRSGPSSQLGGYNGNTTSHSNNRGFNQPNPLDASDSPMAGGRLSLFASEWTTLSINDWLLNTIRTGFQLHFHTQPPLSHRPRPIAPFNQSQDQLLSSEIHQLLSKGTIESVNPQDPSPGFYSSMFVIPKRNGGHRPVFNLKNLNQYLTAPHFKMETIEVLSNMPMLHGSLTNHNPTSPSQEGPTSQSHGSNVHGPNALRSSSDLWKTFSAHARGFRGSKVTIFEDSNAKNAAHECRRAQLWIQSSELNSAVFDLAQMPITPASFFTALAAQYTDAIGAVPVRQGTTNGTVIAFDTEESRTKACTIGITIDRFTVIGTPTLKPESTIIRVSLEKLPLLRPQALTPMITSSLSKYGRVLDVGLYRDPVTQLFFGKGYVLLDTSTADGIQFLPLEHEIDLGQRRLVYASWRGMAKHCFYCHKPGHTKVDCPRLSNQKIKRCYSCDSIEHLFRDCPRRQTPATSSKRQRAEDVDLPLHTQDHNAVEQQLQSTSVTAADADIVAAQPQTNENTTILASTSNAQVDTDSQQTQEEPDDEDDSDYQPSTEEDDGSSMDECEDTDGITIDEDEVRQLQDESARDSTSSNVGSQRSGPTNLDSSTTASLNCRGLKKILSSSGRSFSRTLRSLHFDILALQETHADSLDIQTRFDQCLQPSGCLWTKHCGLLSFNPAVSFDPLWSSVDGRVLVARVNHLSGLYAPLCIYVIYAPASRSERLSFFSNLDALLRYDQRPSDRCILLGDFNHNVHSRSDSPSLRPWQHLVRSFLHDPLRDDPVCRDLLLYPHN